MHKLLLDTSLLEELPVAIGIADFDGNIVYFNKQFTQTFGYTTSDVPNLEKWTKTVYPEENYRNWALNIWNCEVQRRMHTNVQPTPHEFNILCKDGETRIVEISFNIKDNYILTFFRDVTALAKSIENVSLEKKFSDKLINSLPGNFYLFERIEKQFKLIRWNKNFFNYLGYTTEQLESMPPKDIIAEEEHESIDNFITQVLEDGYGEHELFVKKKNGEKHLHFVAGAPYFEKDRTFILGVGYDISKQKQIEEDLKISKLKAEESEKLKSAFLANMSHEIRTPLNGILGFSSLLNNEAISIEDRSYYIDIINQSSNQLLSIVDDILSLSKLETGQYEVLQEKVCINGLIDELVVRHTPKASEKGISLSSYFGLSSDKSIVLSDSSLLKQILENLISNAIKFTQNGHVLIGYTIENDFIQFYIEDSGIGIDKEFHSKIFDRFQQVDIESTRVYGGTGLGLTIAKGTCELLGGKIWLDSEQEHGSKFLFTIPYIPTQQSQLTQTITTKEDSMNPKTNVILIAEDEEINFLYLEESLRDFEYEIVRAHDGEEAVEICKNDERISLVLMDIKMPNMDGYTALKEIQKIRPELPIIAQTAYAMLSDKEMALEAGFKDYLAKPIKTADLFNTLNQYLTK